MKKKYVRIYSVASIDSKFSAVEYLSDVYLDRSIDLDNSAVVWKSNEALTADEMISVLLSRGWHQTDIGDALSEARRTGVSAGNRPA